MESLRQDIRYALRSFARQPALTIIAVLSLGFGIGATSTVFTWLQGMVLNPLPAIPGWDRVVVAQTRNTEGGAWSVSYPDFQDWRAGSSTMDLAAWDMMPVGLRDGTGPTERTWALLVSGNYFEDLRVRPAFGRLLRIQDEEQRAPVAVLGHNYWRRRFAADSGVIGRTVTLNGAAYTIVGVAGRRFVGNYIGMDFHMYVPMATFPLLTPDGAALITDRQRRSIEVIGRLKEGATLEQANAELDPLAKRAGAAAGLAQPLGAIVKLHKNVDAPGALRPLLIALLAVAGLVLLIACANVANLLLARAVARRREIAVRLAVGASRMRLVRQLLTESLALAVMSGVLGIVLTFWFRDSLMNLLPAVPYPVGLDMTVSSRVIAFVTVVTALTAVAFGLMPALQASRPELVPALKDEIGDGSGSRGRLQGALVVAQIALSLVTLVTAGLFVRSLGQVRSIDTGMTGLERVMLVSTDLRLTGLTGDSVPVTIVRGLLERVRVLPGVEHASVARALPLGPAGVSTSAVTVEGYAPRPDENMHVAHNTVSDDYLATLGIRLVEGRTLSAADGADNAPVVMVNEAFANRFLSGRGAIGARLNLGGDEWMSVVGVLATTKINEPAEEARPLILRPFSLRTAPTAFTLHIRASGDPAALTGGVRAAFSEVSGDLPFLDHRNMEEFTSISYWPQKVGAVMLGAAGTLALLLAAIGIYGTMAYSVSRRVREIGVRVALGAARRQVVQLVVGRGMKLTAIGLLIGLSLSLLIGQALASQLHGISPRDPVAFGGVTLMLAAVSLLACAIPARRAARINPLVALRHD